VLCGHEHLEGEKRDADYVVSEDKRAKDVCVLAVLLRRLVLGRATRHQLQDVQNLVKEL